MVVRGIAWIVQAALVGGWLLISSLYIRAAWILGRLPLMERDDPTGLALGLHYKLVGPAVVVVLVATAICCVLGVLLGVVFAVAKRTPRSRRGMRVAWHLFVAGVLSVLVWFLFPFVPWYLD